MKTLRWLAAIFGIYTFVTWQAGIMTGDHRYDAMAQSVMPYAVPLVLIWLASEFFSS